MKRLATCTIPLLPLLSGCAQFTRLDHVPTPPIGGRQLVVFMDGTANDESSHTNVAKLHNLVTLQDRNDIAATYIYGVGTGAKVIGASMGWGIGHDVREAHLFLMENHNHKDDTISVFGFSRGAYAARILSGLLYVAGVPDIYQVPADERSGFAKKLYDAFKGNRPIPHRRRHVAEVLKHYALPAPAPVNVKFLGLWDTVEALGWPDYRENINDPNPRYPDQLCNIENAAHALSVDDDRARVFTPLPITRRHLRQEKCDIDPVDEKSSLSEVWFPGAHSDVGGGYSDTDIDGLSLNWMLDKLDEASLNLVPPKTAVYANYLDTTHDPEGGIYGLIYRKRNRDIPNYTEYQESDEKCKRDATDYDTAGFACEATAVSTMLRLHQSVADRLCMKTPEGFESFWYKHPKYQNCLSCTDSNQGRIRDGAKNNTGNKCSDLLKLENNPRYGNKWSANNSYSCDIRSCPEARGSDYKVSQSCNYGHPLVPERAKQRLTTKRLDDPASATTIVFFPDVETDRTGIVLSSSMDYYFEIAELKHWVDCERKDSTISPEEGRPTLSKKRSFKGNFLSAVGKPLAYYPLENYMELVAEVNGEHFKIGELIKASQPYSPSADGELILRVNEPRGMESAYNNNFGELRLKITPTREEAPAIP